MAEDLQGDTPKETPLRLLIADDDQNDVDLCLRYLRKCGVRFEAQCVSTPDSFAKSLKDNPVDVVISDYRMGAWTGLDALAIVRQIQPDTPLILMTGTLGDELAVEAIKAGVTDYILKGQFARLPIALKRAQEERMLRGAEVRAIRALRESENHYRTLVQYAPEAIVLLDVGTGRFVDCNDNATKLFQLSREELLNKGPIEMSPPVQPDGRASSGAATENVNRAMRGEVPRFEWTHQNSRGEQIPCEVHLVRLASTSGGLLRGSIQDITERKQAEAALRASEARYRSLVNNASYGIFWVKHEGKLLFVNPALVRMLGYETEEEVLALNDTRAFYFSEAEHEAARAQFFATGHVDATVNWKRKDGKTIHVRINGRETMHPEGGGKCIEIIVEDVTERDNLEKQLRQAQKL
jgi:PAS domain S-box-containing protein